MCWWTDRIGDKTSTDFGGIYGLRVHDCEDMERYSTSVGDDGAFAGLRQLRDEGKIKQVLGISEDAD